MNSSAVTYNSLVREPLFRPDKLIVAVRDAFSEVAIHPERQFRFASGSPSAERLNYNDDLLSGIPESAVESFAGVGNVFDVGPLIVGERVLDIGCGAGLDSLIAAKLVGNRGTVTGIDVSNQMVRKARKNATKIGAWNTRFMLGYAESIAIGDNSVDLVISNGAINLSVDKGSVFREIFRVLDVGGRFQIADVILDKPVPSNAHDFVPLWTNFIAGAEQMDAYLKLIKDAGFRHVELIENYDVFKGTQVAVRARKYGAKGYTIRGWK